MTTYLNRVRVLLAVGAMALIGLFVAAPAQADQYDFVSNLDNNGVYYSSISGVIRSRIVRMTRLRSL